ncbi:MAG: hypothetical protein A4S09_07285 [Proteobacteria bacterium SG_bin7]|nr:MAG: hypothetical protein A4S09_07285 [Proteobacteria bacterium SG_bin7]
MIVLKQIIIKEILAINNEINRIRGIKSILSYGESYEMLSKVSERELYNKLDQMKITYNQLQSKGHLRLIK